MVGEGLPGGTGGWSPAFAAGARIAGYRLEEEIGAGGMAVVFRARDERLGRPVALKVLAPGLAGDGEFRRRFLRESRAAGAVDDPHIIPVYEAGEAGGVLFIAMRYVSGGDVRGLLRREGPLPPGRAAAIISPVAAALDAAHGAGLVHRDVKPANMLIDARPGRPDHVYLSDFGLAKGGSSSVLTGAGLQPGTVAYMAPEQIQGGVVDGRADQYALGCAAFELLCEVVPFERDQDMAVIYAHLSVPPPSLASRRPGLPAAVDEVLGRALAKAPADRFDSCREFAEALRGALGLPGYAHGPGAALAGAAAARAGAPAGGTTVIRPAPGGGSRRARELPSGVVTFLFGDIEGSARPARALRERYRQALAEHRRLVREAIAGQDGHELDTPGDAFLVAFAGAKQAVLCAAEIQRVLARHQWPAGARVRVRIGVHTGQAVPAGGAHTDRAVRRAAGICAAARGGQVLVSRATQAILEDEEELGFALVDLGERKLEDLDLPVRLFQLAALGLDPWAPQAAGQPEPGRTGAGPAEERKLATVLFADLVGSTALAEGQDPERVRAMLNRFYDAMAAEVEWADGTVEKFAGDAVMAAFGAPVAHEDDAERALHVALGMQRRLAELFGGRLAVRIGVNTGDVVAGQPRQGSSFVTGDAVNVCARLEQAAAPGEILVGERTVAATRGAFEFAEPEMAEAKGKPGGIACRKLVRALSLMRPRGLGGQQPVFVGRARELADLQQVFGRVVTSGTPHLVCVVGDAGVGKTRLLREFWQWLGGQPRQPFLRTGRCPAYGKGITYWPLGEVLKEHFGILDSDPPEAVAGRVAGRDGLGFTLGLAPPAGMHPLTVRDRLHTSWLGFLQELTAERPAAVLVEDLHWADDELCDLLAMLVERVPGPLLLLATARPELLDRRPGWAQSARESLVRLEALPSMEAGQLIAALLGGDCPGPVRELITGRAEGNPFFVEELIATLIDRGVLARQDGGWSFGELPPGFSVPDTVQAVLAARIDLLPGAEKAALQTAAVIGRVFWSGPVRALAEDADPDFGLLEQRDFVLRHAGSSIQGQREYTIKHALTREVAYASLLKARRAPLHAGFAEWLERTGKGADEHAPLLAHHYAEAVRPDDLDLAWPGREEQAGRLRIKAVWWSRRAADLAIARYEIDQGLALLHRALSLESDTRQHADLWRRIGQACALKYDGEGFWHAMQQALEIGGPSADVYADLALQTILRGGMWVQQPDPEWTLLGGWIQQAMDLAEEGSLTQGQALVARYMQTDDESAARSALAIAERLGDSELRCTSLHNIAYGALLARDFDRACTLTDEVMAVLPGLPNPDVCCMALMSAVFVYLRSGRLGAAARASAQATETAAGLTPHHRLHAASWRILLSSATGRWDEVRALAAEAERVADANLAAATPCVSNVSILLNCAAASALAGDEDEARRLESKAQGIGMDGGRWYQGWFEPPQIRLALARHDLGVVAELVPPDFDWEWEPVSTFLDALAALGDRERIEADAPKWLQRGTFGEPFALRALGIARGDQALLRQALERFEAMELSWHADQTRRLL
jgi:class 3 adenylate cyclase